MMPNSAPLTKQDLELALHGLEDRLDARWEAKLDRKLDQKLDQKLKGFATKEDLKAFATKKDLEAFPTKEDAKAFATKADLDRWRKESAVHFAQLSGEVRDIRLTLATGMATKSDLLRFGKFADFCAAQLDESRELRATRGQLLGEVSDKVADHERRLSALESKPGTS